MKLKEITACFNEMANFSIQESYDNSGIQIGNPDKSVHSALLCIDITMEIIEEAIHRNTDLIISHHPLIFAGLKSLSGRNEVERIVEAALLNGISILSVHTNLDAVQGGVNSRICDKLGLKNQKILQPLEESLLKLVFFVPEEHADNVRDAVFKAGAGVIGNYDSCSFSHQGTGSFRAGDNTHPLVGEKGKLHLENETRIETVLPSVARARVIQALIESHPYEEVAYDLYPLKNTWNQAGMGMYGDLTSEMKEMDFLKMLKEVFETDCIRYTSLRNKSIKKVAVCGGSGSFLLKRAISVSADVFVSGDFKYHQFFEAEGKILIADIGHYESEQFTKEIFYELLTKKNPKFAVHLSKVNTNPINYL